MNYTSRTRPQRGEVLVRGHNVFLGYYKNDEETYVALCCCILIGVQPESAAA